MGRLSTFAAHEPVTAVQMETFPSRHPACRPLGVVGTTTLVPLISRGTRLGLQQILTGSPALLLTPSAELLKQ